MTVITSFNLAWKKLKKLKKPVGQLLANGLLTHYQQSPDTNTFFFERQTVFFYKADSKFWELFFTIIPLFLCAVLCALQVMPFFFIPKGFSFLFCSFSRKACISLTFGWWFTGFSQVLPTSYVVLSYYKAQANVIYCLRSHTCWGRWPFKAQSCWGAGWRSGKSAHLLPMWPGFDSPSQHYNIMWVVFVVT